jgi:hypothetical protein
MRRWRNKIARRDHAIHEYTSWLAAHGGDIVIERPPLRQATATGAGTVYDPGALVAFKARMNRDLLDRGIGKFCEVLTYKVQARGRAVTVTERPDHSAMIPALATETARLAKRVQRAARRPRQIKGTEMTSKTTRVLSSIVCDRCGTTHPQAKSDLIEEWPKGWGHVQAHAFGPHRIVPDRREDGKTMVASLGMFAMADLCPDCTDAFFAWWTAVPRDGGAA